ncbi:hypothetical protein N9260_02200 [bacterium]|nr:hypothetical protein [bacterium]
MLLLSATSAVGDASAALIESCLFLPLGVLLSVVVIEIFAGSRKGIDLDKAVVVLLVTGSVLFFIGAFLTFSQASALGQQIAVKAAGAGMFLGIVCAVAAMLKQQCYLQKLLAAARARTRQRSAGGGLWPVLYSMILIITVGGGVAAAWLRPDLQGLAAAGGSTPESDLLVVEEEADSTDPSSASGGDVVLNTASNAEPFSTASELFADESELSMEEPMEMEMELAESDPEPMPELVEPAKEPVFEPESDPQPKSSVVAITAKIDPGALSTFKGSVVPMLKGRCLDCHGVEKQKGGLRLDSPSWIRQGGNSGPVVVAFDPDKSYLYTSTVLPGDDPDIMPAKGKPLTSAQTSAIKRWIRGGAPMGDGKDQEVASAAAAAQQAKSGGQSTGGGELAGSLAEVLKQAHIEYKPIDGGLFEIDCSLSRNYPEVKLDLSVLDPIADKIHTLDLSKTKIKDAGLAPVARFKNLRILLLSRTTVGDEALVHLSGLMALEILNLYGTNVSNAGLENLKELANLKKLYLWNSKATRAGGDRLKKVNRKLEVNVGQ